MKHFLIFSNSAEQRRRMMTFHKKIGSYLIVADIMAKLLMESLKDGEFLSLMMAGDMKACLPTISSKDKANYPILTVSMWVVSKMVNVMVQDH